MFKSCGLLESMLMIFIRLITISHLITTFGIIFRSSYVNEKTATVAQRIFCNCFLSPTSLMAVLKYKDEVSNSLQVLLLIIYTQPGFLNKISLISNYWHQM